MIMKFEKMQMRNHLRKSRAIRHYLKRMTEAMKQCVCMCVHV